jgi:hypothetical protein
MKKKFFLILSLGLLLTSCDFQARDEFEKQLAADEKKVDKDFKMPDISYEKAGEESSTNNDNKTDEKLDLTNLYGSGKAGTNLNPADAVGNIIDTSIGESQISISLRPSSQVAGAYSTILSYKRNNELTEREFGPIAGINGLNTVVTFDKVSSDSGPMLLVSQVTINNGETYSAYYIFNKFMSLMDYLVFRTSTNDTTPTVERLDDIVEYTDQAIPGDLNKAIKNRMEAEDRYLPSLLDVYSINYKSVKSLYENKEMDIGYLPDITGKDRILLTKTTTSTDNMGMNIDMEK